MAPTWGTNILAPNVGHHNFGSQRGALKLWLPTWGTKILAPNVGHQHFSHLCIKLYYFLFQSSASLNHSASASSHQHTHHHTHHHERMSPGNPVLSIRHGMHPKPPQTNPHHLMIQPPSMGHHGPPLGRMIIQRWQSRHKYILQFRNRSALYGQ